MENSPKLYRSEAVQTPSLSTIGDISRDLGFNLSDDDLPHYQKMISNWAKTCTLLDEQPEPTLPVKYPRTPGYRPTPEENTHNAWYYKTDIKGAPEGLLKGKKVAIKDNVPVSGVPMMVGSRLMEGYVPEFDATLVTRILDAGGIIKGKAVCEDFCSSASSFLTAKGAVCHPIDRDRSAGGSSSGSAVLLALGEVDMAIGGDQGGSIRIPASWCGIVGLKPTYGLVPYTGVLSLEPVVDYVGPMATTVKDCALLLQAIAGYDDGLDPRQHPNITVPLYSELMTGEVGGLKIGLLIEGFDACEPGVQSVVREAAKKGLRDAKVEEVSILLHNQASFLAGPLFTLGIHTLYDSCGAPFGQKGFCPTSMIEYQSRALKARPNDVNPLLKALSINGEYHKRFYGPKYYCKSMNASRRLEKAYDDMLDKYDALIMPTATKTASKLPVGPLNVESLFEECLGHGKNTSPFNVTGHPAVSVPAGLLGGLPVGMMIVGKHYHDGMVLNIAQAIENWTNTTSATA